MTNPTPPTPPTPPAPPAAVPPPAAPPAADPPADPPAPSPGPAAGDAGEQGLPEPVRRALAAERRAAAEAGRALKAAEARIKEFEDRDKSELDRATERATAAERRAAEAEAAAVRLQVIAETGLPAELAEFLPASGTAEELRAKADKLKAAVGAQRPGPPRPDPSQGSRGPTASAGLEEQIAAAQKAGRWREVLALQRQKLNHPA